MTQCVYLSRTLGSSSNRGSCTVRVSTSILPTARCIQMTHRVTQIEKQPSLFILTDLKFRTLEYTFMAISAG